MSFGQISNLFLLEYDKEYALYYGKYFLMTDVLGSPSSDYSKFEIEPLTASNSREITTVYYNSDEKNLEGLVFGFFISRVIYNPPQLLLQRMSLYRLIMFC